MLTKREKASGRVISAPAVEVASLVESTTSEARNAVTLARDMLRETTGLLEAARTLETTPTADALVALRRALNEVHTVRRALETTLNDVMDLGDRVLDAYDARPRHVLR